MPLDFNYAAGRIYKNVPQSERCYLCPIRVIVVVVFSITAKLGMSQFCDFSMLTFVGNTNVSTKVYCVDNILLGSIT